jgi:bifunctional DNase/RNase
MFKKIKYLTTINNTGFFTSYFFDKESKSVLPMETFKQASSPTQPKTSNTIRRILVASGINVQAIKIYLYKDDTFYTYITIKKDDRCYDINAGFLDAVKIGQEFNAPIYTTEKVIKDCGIKVTKELIEKSLVGQV